MKAPRIQAAGVMDLEEALMMARCGVDSLGFPLRLPVHAPDTSEAEAARIVAGLDRAVSTVLITYMTGPREIAELADFLGVDGVQLHAPVQPRALAELKRLRPGLFLIKSLVVRPDAEAELTALLAACAPHADAFLTDTHDPATGADGATGLTHDWDVSRRLALASPRPLILAGGLNPGNVRRAVLAVRPAGVDAHTGLEGPDGRKDQRLVREFASRAEAAFAEAGLPRPA